MTEQRFWLVPLNYEGEQRFVRDNMLVGEKSMSNQEVVDYLNKITEENEQLKQRIKRLERGLERERNATTQIHLKWSDEAETMITELAEENEQLKNSIREAYKNERTTLGKNVLKQLIQSLE